MITTTLQATTVAPPPSPPRLVLAPVRAAQAVLDGGWWPRSWDPVAELPGLLLTLSDRYGQIRQVMLNAGTWDSRIRRLTVGPRVARIGWFASAHPAVLIATTDGGKQVDLLVVPASTATAAADTAMRMAADPANTMRAPDILAALATTPSQDPGNGGAARSAWDNEGGHLAEPGPRRLAEQPSASPRPA